MYSGLSQTSGNRMYNKSRERLRRILANLPHLDLTGRVQYDNRLMAAGGGYADVFNGTLYPPSFYFDGRAMKVAVKRIRVNIQKDKDFEKLLAKELYIWSQLNHENILPLQGFVLEGDFPLVIAEWMENGTVREYLMGHPDCNIVAMILGIAEGVNYLHEQDIVHSDLKSDNVLVSSHGTPLICDFGISRMLCSSMSVTEPSTGGVRGSARWMAIELLDTSGNAKHTKESDVWAFGMTTYEIIRKERPYANFGSDVQVICAIMKGNLPPCPPDYGSWPPLLRFMWEICENCWTSPPSQRIPMKPIVNLLRVEGAITSNAHSLLYSQGHNQTLQPHVNNLYDSERDMFHSEHVSFDNLLTPQPIEHEQFLPSYSGMQWDRPRFEHPRSKHPRFKNIEGTFAPCLPGTYPLSMYELPGQQRQPTRLDSGSSTSTTPAFPSSSNPTNDREILSDVRTRAEKLSNLLPHADTKVLSHYLWLAGGSDHLALGQYLQDKSAGTLLQD